MCEIQELSGRIRLNPYEPPKAFRSFHDFAQFCEIEAQKFRRLHDQNDAAYKKWGQQLQSWWHSASQKALSGEITLEGLEASIRSTPCFEFESSVVDLLQELSASGQNYRLEGAIKFLDNRTDGQNVSTGQAVGAAQMAAVITVRDRISPVGTRKMLSEVLDKHEANLSQILDFDREHLEEKRHDFGSALQEMRAAYENYEQNMSQFFANAKSNWETAYNSYIIQLQTQTAVELWQTRAVAHTDKYKSFRNWSVGVGLIGGIITLIWLFTGMVIAEWAFSNDQTARIVVYTAGSLTTFTLLMWVLRVLVRSMISESHLATDASGRSAMAHTYLALTKTESASQEDRAIILAGLFAPVSDGLVRDDGMPVLSPSAMAAAILTNPKAG